MSGTFRFDINSKNVLLSFSMKPHAPIKTVQYMTFSYCDSYLFMSGLYFPLFLVLLPTMFVSKPIVSSTSVTFNTDNDNNNNVTLYFGLIQYPHTEDDTSTSRNVYGYTGLVLE